MNRFAYWMLLLPCFLGSLLGCQAQYTIIEHSDVHVPVTGDQPTVLIEMFNGPIQISTVAGNEITGQLTVRAVGADKEEAEKEIQAIDFDIQPNVEGKIVIKAIRKDGSKSWNGSGTEIQVQVPERCRLELVSSNGRILVDGRARGVQARSSNGSITLQDIQNAVNVKTTNGAVNCTGVVGEATIETSNAMVNVTGKRMLLQCKSSHGSIRFAGDLAPGNHRVQTSNSNITATLPADTQLTLDASTSNGRISNDFKLQDANSNRSRNNLKGMIGASEAGKTTLTLKTSNSSISIKRSKGNPASSEAD